MDKGGLDKTLAEIETRLINEALARSNGNMTKAADDLGINYRSIRYRTAALGIREPKKIAPKGAGRVGWYRLRSKVFARDGGRCQCCGATSKHGIRLEVDHIRPKSTHPELAYDIDNLQVLCVICNRGKSNTQDIDWRSKS